MSEERFKLIKIDDYVFQIHDIDNDLYLVAEQICNLLNEEQARIRELEEEKMELEKKLEFKTLKQEEKDKQIEEDYARLQRRKILERSGNCEPLTLKYNPNNIYMG